MGTNLILAEMRAGAPLRWGVGQGSCRAWIPEGSTVKEGIRRVMPLARLRLERRGVEARQPSILVPLNRAVGLRDDSVCGAAGLAAMKAELSSGKVPQERWTVEQAHEADGRAPARLGRPPAAYAPC